MLEHQGSLICAGEKEPSQKHADDREEIEAVREQKRNKHQKRRREKRKMIELRLGLLDMQQIGRAHV